MESTKGRGTVYIVCKAQKLGTPVRTIQVFCVWGHNRLVVSVFIVLIPPCGCDLVPQLFKLVTLPLLMRNCLHQWWTSPVPTTSYYMALRHCIAPHEPLENHFIEKHCFTCSALVKIVTMLRITGHSGDVSGDMIFGNTTQTIVFHFQLQSSKLVLVEEASFCCIPRLMFMQSSCLGWKCMNQVPDNPTIYPEHSSWSILHNAHPS